MKKLLHNLVPALALVFCTGLLPAVWSPVFAADCVTTNQGTFCQPGSDERSQQLVTSTHAAAQSVRNALAARFFGGESGAGVVEALGYVAESDDGTGGAFDNFEQETAAVPLNNLWGDVTGYYSDRTSATAGFQGALVQGSIGIDHQFGAGTVLGIFGLLNTSHYDTQSGSGAGTSDATGKGIGLYAGQLIGDMLFADAVVSYTRADNSFTVAATGASYASDIASVSGGLTGLFQFDYLRFSPNVNVAYTSEWQEGYTETSGSVSPARRTETGVLTAGFETGYTIFTSAGQAIEPWAGAEASWTFLDRTDPAPAPSPDPVNDFDVRLKTGINAALSDTVSLSLRADVSGLTTPDYIVAGAGAQLSGRF